MRTRQSILFIAALLLAVILLCNCSPAKKALREQENYRKLIEDYKRNNPPRIDTNTVYVPGKKDTVPVKVPVTDTAALHKVKDSMKAAFAIKVVQQQWDCDRQVNEAFNVGYEQARYEMQNQQQVITQPDTVFITKVPTTYIGALQDEVKTLQGQLTEARNKHTYLLEFIIACAVALLELFFLIRSTAKNIKQ